MIRTSLNIATLNCRCLRKAHNPSSSNSFIRYLRSLNIDMLCLQETHAADAQIMAQFDMLFNTHSSLWSPHCGIVSLHRNLTICALPSLAQADGRFLCASVASDTDPSTPILHLLNIYAPAQSRPRQLFFQQLVDTPPLMSCDILQSQIDSMRGNSIFFIKKKESELILLQVHVVFIYYFYLGFNQSLRYNFICMSSFPTRMTGHLNSKMAVARFRPPP
ncbi:hypothetical protein BD560DRAFT_327804 [Blakeslea trispora]|nr:hypothetical protein BD560DRAFT_327804 [Blakeslea trispora]